MARLLLKLLTPVLVLAVAAPATAATPPEVGLIWAVDRSLLNGGRRPRELGRALHRLFITSPLRLRVGLIVYGQGQSAVVLKPHRPRGHDYYRRLLKLALPGDWRPVGLMMAIDKAWSGFKGKRAVIVVTDGRHVPRPPAVDWRPGLSGPAVHVVYWGPAGQAPPSLTRLAREGGGQVREVSRARGLFRTMLRALDVVVRGGRLFLATPGGPRPDALKAGPRTAVTIKLRSRHARDLTVLTGTALQLPPGLYQVGYPGFTPRVAKVIAGKMAVLLLGRQGRLVVRCFDRAGRSRPTEVKIVDPRSGQVLRRGRCFRPIILPTGNHHVVTGLRPDQPRQVWVHTLRTTTIRVDFSTRLMVRVDNYDGEPLRVRYLIQRGPKTVGTGLTGRPQKAEPGPVRIKVLTRPQPVTIQVKIVGDRWNEVHVGRLARLTVQGPPRTRSFFVILAATDDRWLYSGQAGRAMDLLPGHYKVCPSVAKRWRKLCRAVDLGPGQEMTIQLPRLQSVVRPPPKPVLNFGGGLTPAPRPVRPPRVKPRLRPLHRPPPRLKRLRPRLPRPVPFRPEPVPSAPTPEEKGG